MHEPLFTLKSTGRLTSRSENKMKTFTGNDPSLVEKKVNEWLAVNDVELLHIGQSQSEKGGNFVFTISLFYTPV